MKVVPLISSVFYLTAVILGFTSLTNYWSSTSSYDVNNIYTVSDLGLDTAKISLSSLLPSNFRTLIGSAGGEIDLANQENARNLFKLAGDYKSDKHASLLMASKTMLLCSLVSTGGAFTISALQTFKFPFYSKIWAIVPLLASVATLVFGILSVSFFGTVHNSLRNSALYEAKYSTGFTCALLSTIFGALPMITSIIDLSLPNRLRGNIYPLSNVMNSTATTVTRTTASNEAMPTANTIGITNEKLKTREESPISSVPTKVSGRRGTGEPLNDAMDVPQYAK